MAQDYQWIRKWGKFVGSFNYYIEDQVAEARKDNAPQTAICKDMNGHWSTIDDITASETRKQLGLDNKPSNR